MRSVPPIRTRAADRTRLPVQENIPPTRAGRQAMLEAVQEHVRRCRPTPPMTFDELSRRTDALLEAIRAPRRYREFLGVLLNNEVWREPLAGIPYSRRLLLLPKCLSHPESCQGRLDPYGLVCRHCGRCVIHDVQTEAERLGYIVLVAEGSPTVTSLIESGRVEAVVGVSCLGVLRRVFPYMEAAAIPGLAVPLLRDGCRDTDVDLDWVWEAVYCTSDDRTRRLDLSALRRQVESWFAPSALEELMGPCQGQTQQIARDWLCRSGKRWRPFLAVCASQALSQDPQADPAPDLRRIAVAVECFHKASLVHDDIEDDDRQRYGQRTLHEEHGVPVALNVGDYLLGEGYCLIAACRAADGRRAEMLRVAAGGHRELSLGQGAELCWRRDRRALACREVLDIFRRKTAPAFEVALRLGALYAGADGQVSRALSRYSGALGIAYQIADDLSDSAPGPCDDLRAGRPSFLLALAHARSAGADRALLEQAWRGRLSADRATDVEDALSRLEVRPAAAACLGHYRRLAVRCLHPIENPNLKGLLRRVLGKIFDELPAMECCVDHRPANPAQRRPGG